MVDSKSIPLCIFSCIVMHHDSSSSPCGSLGSFIKRRGIAPDGNKLGPSCFLCSPSLSLPPSSPKKEGGRRGVAWGVPSPRRHSVKAYRSGGKASLNMSPYLGEGKGEIGLDEGLDGAVDSGRKEH